MTLRRFLCDRRGNVSQIFALAIIPIMGFVGAAVDYSRASSARAALQGALDSAALMLSKEATGLSATQITEKATQYVKAVLNRPETKDVIISATYTTQPSKITVSATGALNSDIMRIVGVPKIGIGTSSTVTWGSSKLRVALALDNTGSMAQSGKMTALKTATKNLLNQLKAAAAQPGDVQVAIIPFNKDVNVGKSKYLATWIDWTAWDAANGSYSGGSGFCFGNYCWDGSNWVPKIWVAANHNTWNGCVADRNQDYDTKNTAPNISNISTLFPAEQFDDCPIEMLPMTYDWNALSAKVDQMTPVGNTNQTIGMVWGWHALSQTAPLNAPAMDPNNPTSQVIILLTDGLNTQSRFSSSASAIDARTKKACENAKAAGIIVYTVLVMEGNGNLLKECASDNAKYFALTSSSQLVAAFDQIGTNLSKLRIAK